jgi:hypothetical protein
VPLDCQRPSATTPAIEVAIAATGHLRAASRSGPARSTNQRYARMYHSGIHSSAPQVEPTGSTIGTTHGSRSLASGRQPATIMTVTLAAA